MYIWDCSLQKHKADVKSKHLENFREICCKSFKPRIKNNKNKQWPQLESSLSATSHLFIHEDVDDRVDDGARLGQDRGDDARLGRDQAGRPEGGQQCHDPVRHPAEQVADHHDHHHEQHALLALPAQRRVDPAHLQAAQERRGEKSEA